MTVEEMAERILECVRRQPGATFAEIQGACGEEAYGDLELAFGGDGDWKNIVLWAGTSTLFANAFNAVKKQLEPYSGDQALLCYFYDGAALKLPVISNSKRKKPPKTRCWLPLTFSRKAA
jgi:hypothetical protein